MRDTEGGYVVLSRPVFFFFFIILVNQLKECLITGQACCHTGKAMTRGNRVKRIELKTKKVVIVMGSVFFFF